MNCIVAEYGDSSEIAKTSVITTFFGHTWQVVPSNNMSLISRSVCFDGLLGRIIKHLSGKAHALHISHDYRYDLLLLLAQQPLSVKACLYDLLGWLSVTYGLPTPHSRIVSPTYGGTVYLGLEPMTGMVLSRTS